MKKVDIDKFMKEILINYPKVEKMVKSKKMKLEEIPIIVYCARKSCEAGRILADCLLKNNFVNILDYEGGLKDYYKRKFKKNLF